MTATSQNAGKIFSPGTSLRQRC